MGVVILSVSLPKFLCESSPVFMRLFSYKKGAKHLSSDLFFLCPID